MALDEICSGGYCRLEEHSYAKEFCQNAEGAGSSSQLPLGREALWVDGIGTAVRHARIAVTDAAAGIGAYVSNLQRLPMLQVVAPRVEVIGAGLARFGGAAMAALPALYRLNEARKEDDARADGKTTAVRRELTQSAFSISAGLGAGAVGSAVAGATIAAGAPVWVPAAITGATIFGAAVAAAFVRDRVGEWYEGK